MGSRSAISAAEGRAPSDESVPRSFPEASTSLASRRPEKLDEVRRSILARGGRAEAIVTDVSRLTDIRALAERVRALAHESDRHIVLVNNAGLGFTKAALDVGEPDWQMLFDTHVKGTFFCAQQIAPLMLERGYGKVINMSSTWSVTTDVGKSVYCAAKAAVSQLTAALSTEWAPLGIRVNALAPTTTMTEFVQQTMSANPERAERLRNRIKLGRFGQPADLVGAAIYLASSASDFVTGQTLFVDGGFTT